MTSTLTAIPGGERRRRRINTPTTGFFIAPDGSDSGAGTIDDPWLSLINKVNSEGTPGSTFWCRGGLYLGQGDKTLTNAGTDGSPITVRAYPGETPVFSGAYPEFMSIGNSDWEVHDAGRSIYRSVNAYTDGITYVGARMYHDGRDFNLVTYPPTFNSTPGYDCLAADDDRYLGPGFSWYCGPGVWWDEDNTQGQGAKIYIRLVKRADATLYGVEMTHFPTDLDPRNHEIRVFNDRRFLLTSAAREWFVWDGLHLHDWFTTFGGPFVNWTLRNLSFTFLKQAIRIDTETSHDVLVERCLFNGDVPRSLSYVDIKSTANPVDQHRSAAFTINLVETYNWTFTNNHVVEAYDGGFIRGDPHDWTVTHNTWGTPTGIVRNFLDADHGLIWDDLITMAPAIYNLEYAYNESVGAALSKEGTVTSIDPGKVYLHHNYFENLTKFIYAPLDPNNVVAGGAADTAGWQFTNLFLAHGSVAVTGAPWQVYNNTIAYAPPFELPPTASRLRLEPIPTPNDSGVLHEVMNNILAQVSDSPHIGILPGTISARYYVGEAWDGNAWWLDPAIGTRSLDDWEWLYQVLTDASTQVKYATLAAMKADTTNWDISKILYTPGWENSGIDTVDPDITAGTWVPQGSGIHTGALDLSGRGWPGVDGAYRGAVNPSGGEVIGPVA